MAINIIELTIKEWELMKICWKHKDLTVKDVIDKIPPKQKRSYQTTKTQLDRLVEKGYLGHRKIGPVWIYNPLKSKNEMIKKSIADFSRYVLNGSVCPILIHYIENEKLNSEEIIHLKKIIADIEDD